MNQTEGQALKDILEPDPCQVLLPKDAGDAPKFVDTSGDKASIADSPAQEAVGGTLTPVSGGADVLEENTCSSAEVF